MGGNELMSENQTKILPLSGKPIIRAFPEFAFVDMISNNEHRAGALIFRGEVSDKFDDSWMVDSGKSQISLSDSDIRIEEPFYAPKHIKRVYREAREGDCLILRIDYQQDTNKWDSAGIFFDELKDEYGDFTEHIAAFTNFCGGMLMARAEDSTKTVTFSSDGEQFPIWLKLEVNKSVAVLSLAKSEGKWMELVKRDMTLRQGQSGYVIGLYFSMAERQYYKWMFNNFLNYRLDIADKSVLKYTGIMRDSKHYSINPLLRFSDEYYSIMTEFGGDLIKFIEANINKNRYVEFWLNERYIPGLEAYNSIDHYHEGLVYGYDRSKEILYMIFFVGGKPKRIEVEKSIFLEAFCHSEKGRADRIFLIEFYPSNKPYELDVQRIIEQLEVYLTGENPTKEYMRFIGKEGGVFGIACYDEIANNSEVFDTLLYDIRVSYIIREHKLCMLERVKYLMEMGYLEKENGEELVEQLKTISDKAKVLTNLVIKSGFQTDEDLSDRIKNLLDGLKSEESVCYSKLIACLRNCLEKRS